MSGSVEKRAERIVSEWHDLRTSDVRAGIRDYIARALRAERNAALEEAAQRADEYPRCELLAGDIRGMKSPAPRRAKKGTK